jgi:ribosomal protein S18 acetylase RimI-like enzyme
MPRPYDPARDADELWALKRAFEAELGSGTGDDAKAERYRGKLDGDYRSRYLDWVERCVAEEPRAIHVAESDDALAGYVFVLPESLSMIWDAAVLNEIFVRPADRGTGLADDLLVAAVEVAADQDLPLDRLVLDVDPGNERAVSFYRRHGFEDWGAMVAREL